MQLKRSECYSVLGVSEEASEQEIRAAYKRLAVQHHPDKNDGSEESKIQFQRVNYAYRKLAEEEEGSDDDICMDDDLAMHMFMEMMQRYFRASFFTDIKYYAEWEVKDQQFEAFLREQGWRKHSGDLDLDYYDEIRRKRGLASLQREFQRIQKDFDRNTHPIAVAMRRGDSADNIMKLVTAENVVKDIGLGNTPWHYAAYFERYDVLKLFTSRFDPRPTLTIRNDRGQTPLDLCDHGSPAYQHLYSISSIVADRMAQALLEEEEAEKQQKATKADKKKRQKEKKKAQTHQPEPEKAAPAKQPTQEAKEKVGGEKGNKAKGKTNEPNKANENKQTETKQTPPKKKGEPPKPAPEAKKQEKKQEQGEAPTSHFIVIQGGVAIRIPVAQVQKVPTDQNYSTPAKQSENPTPQPPPEPTILREEIERQTLMLCEMGFEYAQAESAVCACGGDLDAAISLLVRTQSPEPQPGPAPEQVQVEEEPEPPEPQIYTPRICKFWPQGICHLGSRCRFAHEGPGGIAEPSTYVRGGGRGGRGQGGGFSRGQPSQDYYGYQKTHASTYAPNGETQNTTQTHSSRGPTNLPPRLRRAANYSN